MQRTIVFLDANIARVWKELQAARDAGSPTAVWEKMLDNLLDQRLIVDAYQ
jgi:hypothetical protein